MGSPTLSGTFSRRAFGYAGAVLAAGLSLYGCQESAPSGQGGTKEISGQEFPSVKVVGGHFEVTRADGHVLSQAELAGKTLVLGNGGGPVNRLRIAAVARDPADPTGDITLYDFLVPGEQPGQWHALCPGPRGEAGPGFPMAGTWTSTGKHLPSDTLFSLACLSSTEAKCVQLGYVPWRKGPGGADLWEAHQACTRLLRADYCGTGTPHTDDKATVDIYDKFGIQRAEAGAGLSFEAAWGPEGARCVRHVRLANGISLKDLKAECPNLPKARLGDACDDKAEALLYSRSPGK